MTYPQYRPLFGVYAHKKDPFQGKNLGEGLPVGRPFNKPAGRLSAFRANIFPKDYLKAVRLAFPFAISAANH